MHSGRKVRQGLVSDIGISEQNADADGTPSTRVDVRRRVGKRRRVDREAPVRFTVVVKPSGVVSACGPMNASMLPLTLEVALAPWPEMARPTLMAWILARTF